MGAGAAPQGLPPVEPIAALGPRLAELGAALRRARYDLDLLAEAERIAPRQLDAVRRPLVLRFLERRGGPGAVLARLFTYSGAVGAAELEAVLGAGLVRALGDAGVLAPAGGDPEAGRLVARLDVTPLDPVHVLCDPYDAGPSLAMGPGATTAILAGLVPDGAASLLDLGCGAGSLALLAAARGARRAVGTDLNPRAVALARVNALLNGVDAEFREGDLAAPVRGERFAVVVAQPPYVPLPAGQEKVTYLHGGARGDELALAFVAAVPEVLADGGRALVMFDAIDAGGAGGGIAERVRAALGAGPDLALLVGPGPGLELQAVAYASLEDGTLGRGYASAVVRQLDHLEALGARRVLRALAVAGRPRRGPGSPGDASPPGASTVVLQVPSLDVLDRPRLEAWLAGIALAGAPEPALLAARVRPAPGARLREERAPGGEPVFSVRFEPPGLATERQLAEGGAVLLEALAAAPDVAAAAAAFAERAGEPPEAVRATVLAFVREGLGRGLLAPG